MKVIVGGVQVPDSASAGASPSSFDIVSRNVLRVDIPSGATPIPTPVVYRDPSFPCFNQGNGMKDDGTCSDCGALKGQPRAADVAAKQADVDVKNAALTSATIKANAAITTQKSAQAAKTSADADLETAKKTGEPTKINAAQAKANAAATNLTQADQDAAVANAAEQAAVADVKVAKAAVQKASAQTGPIECECKQRYVLDVHVATSNGISNHLFVEVPPPQPASCSTPKTVTTTVTTVTKPNASDGSTTTTTTFEVPTQGPGLPPGTFLPLNTSLPAGSTFVAPGAATINAAPQSSPPAAAPTAPSQPQSANPAQKSNVTPTKPNSATATDSASDPELRPVTGGLLPGAVDRSGPSLSVPPPAVNMAIAGRGNLAVPPPASILPPGSLRSSAPTPGLLRAGIAGMAAGKLGQEHVAAVRNVDPNIQPTAVQAMRSGQGRLFARSQSTKPEPSTSKPITNASPQPTPRRSLLSRVLGGDR
jgi:hypothetical protein